MITQRRFVQALGLISVTIVAGVGAASAAPEGRPAVPAAGAIPPGGTVAPAAGAHGTVGVGGITVNPGGNALPPPDKTPPPLGWPHRVQFASTDRCNRAPFPLEVIVWEDPNFTGRCAVLQPGFYPHDNQLMVRNDSISSIKVGQLVRARVFRDHEFSGGSTTFGPSSTTGKVPGDWNDVITSMRVEMASRHPNCDDVAEGEIGLYSDENFGGDCVVLPGDGSVSFGTAAEMGIANDSISSIWNNTRATLVAYDNSSFSGNHGVEVNPHSRAIELSKDRREYLIIGISGMDDHTSSVLMR